MVTLKPLIEKDREWFIINNQKSFKYGAIEEFGVRDNHFEEGDEIISRDTIEKSIDGGTAYIIICNNEKVGGLVIKIEKECGELELLFTIPDKHSKGIGKAAWFEIEKLYPQIKTWETITPYFEKRNIHFYVNSLGFHIVEFFNSHHKNKNDKDGSLDEMFRFEKVL